MEETTTETKSNEKIILSNIDIVRIVLFFCSRDLVPEPQPLRISHYDSSIRFQSIIYLISKSEEYKNLINNKIIDDKPFRFSKKDIGPYSASLSNIIKILQKNDEIEVDNSNINVTYYLNIRLMNRIWEKFKNPEDLKKIDDLGKLVISAKKYDSLTPEALSNIVNKTMYGNI